MKIEFTSHFFTKKLENSNRIEKSYIEIQKTSSKSK